MEEHVPRMRKTIRTRATVLVAISDIHANVSKFMRIKYIFLDKNIYIYIVIVGKE